MEVPETDSEDEIPPGWEERCTTDGLVFYALYVFLHSGFETARCLAFHGCCVVFACRDLVKAEEKIALLKKERPYTKCKSLQVDLTSLKSVKNFVQNFKLQFKRCDILILNAGVFGLPYTKTEDSQEMHFQVNFLAHFYMCLLMEPLLTLSKDPRVIFVSAESHRQQKSAT
ncbi:WW domain-containing oxidoreductase [Armadillidium vulgare]|nr:WW domain-containing oxidoreductase [Armadillidium vulgare]